MIQIIKTNRILILQEGDLYIFLEKYWLYNQIIEGQKEFINLQNEYHGYYLS